jgi:hypothetical protein
MMDLRLLASSDMMEICCKEKEYEDLQSNDVSLKRSCGVVCGKLRVHVLQVI